MTWLNYHHLHYFWVTAKRGSIAQASKELRLAASTVSAQIQQLEEQLGEELFARHGRSLVLTEIGQTAFRYADEIFSLGTELVDVVQQRSSGSLTPFRVGISDAVPKLVSYRLIEPAFRMGEPGMGQPLRVVCDEDKPDRLFASLAVHELDVVLHDAPLPAGTAVRAYSHVLGECGVSIFGTAALAKKHKAGFPRSLTDAPLLLPTGQSAMRGALDRFFDDNGIRPLIRAEVHDSALMGVIGQSGVGLFPGPTAIEAEVCAQHNVTSLGRLDGVVERYYAITIERRIKHPAVLAVATSAREKLFG